MKKTNGKSFLKVTIIVALTFCNFIMFLPQQVNAQGQGTWISNGNTIVYTNRKVGVKTNLPTKDFDVNGSFRSINAFVDSVLNVWQLIVAGNVSVGGTLNVGQFSLSGNNFISSSGNINFGNNNLTTTGNIFSSNIFNLQSTVNSQQTEIDTLQSVVGNIQSSQWQNNGSNIFYNDGLVGIGTNAPAAKLDIYGSQRLTENLYVGGNVIVSEKFSARTVTSDTTRATKQLLVNHNLKLGSDSGSVNSDISSKAELLKIQSDPASIFDVAISVNDSSKVGIGTKYPSEKLSVEGNVSVSGNITTNSIKAYNMNVTGQTSFDSLHVVNKLKIGNSIMLEPIGLENHIYTTPSSGNLFIQSNSGQNQNTIINGNNIGRVGIGTFNPNTKLHVYSANNSDCGTTLRLEYYFTPSPNGCYSSLWDIYSLWDITASGEGGGNLNFSTPTISVPLMTLSKNGFVEINGQVKINGGTPGMNKILTSDATGLASWQTLNTSAWQLTGNSETTAGTNFIGTTDANSLVFKTSNTEKMRITETGKVGIGTIDPEATLHIFSNCANSGTTLRLQYNYTPPIQNGCPTGTSLWDIAALPNNILTFTNPTLLQPAITILQDGKIGIGTTIPQALVHIKGGDLLLEHDYYLKSKRNGNTSRLIGLSGSGGINCIEIGEATTFPSEVRIYTPTDPGQGVSIHNGTNHIAYFRNDGYIGFGTTAPLAKLHVVGISYFDGMVGIGTNPYASSDYKLAVDGKILCERIKVVSDIIIGADYVFDKNYKLLHLNELENYIDTCKHLPDVPSAEEMKKNGLDLAEMNILLLKKIEELTLYLIKQDKKITELNSKVEILELNKK